MTRLRKVLVLWAGLFLLRQRTAAFQSTPHSQSPATVLGGTTEESSHLVDNDDAVPAFTEEKEPFEGFDYLSCWYPVIWVQDIPANQQAKVRVFDTDYVVIRISKTNEKDQFVVLRQDPWSPQSAADVMREGVIPVCCHQGLVWIFPRGGDTATALKTHPLPSVPEMDENPDRHITTMVRDCPLDWSILVDNILDPDNGLFSHGIVQFDADVTDDHREIDANIQESGEGTRWRIRAQVQGYERLITLPKEHFKKRMERKYPAPYKTCVVEFCPPSLVTWKRIDNAGETITSSFWICPVGVGRSRLLSASIAKSSMSVPRWMLHLFVNKFLDRGSLMMAAQQNHFLNAEKRAARRAGGFGQIRHKTHVRKNNLVCNTPLHRMAIRVAQFWDHTLSNVPNRVPGLLERDASAGLVMDRNMQHLSICPDSQGLVKQCNRVRVASGAFFLWNAAKLLATRRSPAALHRSISVSFPRVVLATVVFRIASKLRWEFKTRHTRVLNDKSRKKVPLYLQESTTDKPASTFLLPAAETTELFNNTLAL